MPAFEIGDKVRLIGGHIVGYEDDKNEGYTFSVGDIFEVVEKVGKGCWIEKGFVEMGINEEFFEIVDIKKSESPLDKQVSGTHYKDCGIQPIEYIHANGLNYFEGNAVKYITRHRKKNGKADIEKAIHYLELMLELEYKEEK